MISAPFTCVLCGTKTQVGWTYGEGFECELCHEENEVLAALDKHRASVVQIIETIRGGRRLEAARPTPTAPPRPTPCRAVGHESRLSCVPWAIPGHVSGRDAGSWQARPSLPWQRERPAAEHPHHGGFTVPVPARAVPRLGVARHRVSGVRPTSEGSYFRGSGS
jgi:hypothetical protein